MNLSKVLYRGGFWRAVLSGGSFWPPSGLKTAPLKPHPKNCTPKKLSPKIAQKWAVFENRAPPFAWLALAWLALARLGIRGCNEKNRAVPEQKP